MGENSSGGMPESRICCIINTVTIDPDSDVVPNWSVALGNVTRFRE